jgi:hypothetical protein
MNAVMQHIEATKAARNRDEASIAHDLRRDEIRKRELWNNWNAVLVHLKTGVDQIKTGFPERYDQVDLHEVPSRQVLIHKTYFPSVDVEAGITLDGARIVVKKNIAKSSRDTQIETRDEVQIDVKGDSTFYVYEGKPVRADEVALVILKPVLDLLR